MANEATVFTKTTSEGADKMVVLEPGQGIISKMNLGDWEEIRMGMFYSYTNLTENDPSGNVLTNEPTFSFDDPGSLWSFGLKDDNRSALVDQSLDTGRFLGIHPIVDNSTRIDIGGPSGQKRFTFTQSPGGSIFSFLAKNEAVKNPVLSTETDTFTSSFGFPEGDVPSGSTEFANIMALRMRKISGDKIRIWIGRIAGQASFGDIRLMNLESLLDDFMAELDPGDQTPTDIDDPFVTENDYPDSFYFYGSSGFEDFRWRVGAFMVKKYEIE